MSYHKFILEGEGELSNTEFCKSISNQSLSICEVKSHGDPLHDQFYWDVIFTFLTRHPPLQNGVPTIAQLKEVLLNQANEPGLFRLIQRVLQLWAAAPSLDSKMKRFLSSRNVNLLGLGKRTYILATGILPRTQALLLQVSEAHTAK